MNRKMRNIVIGMLIAAAAAVAIAGGSAWYLLYAPLFSTEHTVYVCIDRDDDIDSVFNKIRRAAPPRHFAGLRLLASYRDYAANIRTGRYAIGDGESAYQVLSRLQRGYQSPTRLTIGSVRTVDRIAGRAARQLMIDSVEIATLLFDTAYQRTLGLDAATLPCLFVPNTYEVYWNISADGFLRRMKQEHDSFWNDSRRSRAKALGLTPVEVTTLASIVDEETAADGEKPVVAGLYLNRLRIGMPLQADPTVKFILLQQRRAAGDSAATVRRILERDLTIPSPYNTYLNAGLPPGPIRVPSVAGIDAVLNADKNNYLYMCAKEDFSGTHNFAATYAEHLRNARRYQAALNRRDIRR